jgi:hypothetical protein
MTHRAQVRRPCRPRRPCVTIAISWIAACIPRGTTSSQEVCFTGHGTNYTGTANTTICGRTCQEWALDYPHAHDFNWLPSNWCRNPIVIVDGVSMWSARPWCYTNDSSIEWEYCFIPSCSVYNHLTCTPERGGGSVSERARRNTYREIGDILVQ